MRLVRHRAMPAALQGDRVARRIRCRRVIGVHGTGACSNAPARGGRAGRRQARIGDKKTWRRMLGRNETESPRRRQLDFAHDAYDEGEALRAQAFLHRPQGIRSAPRIDEQPPRGPKSESGQSAPVRRPELARELGWPAPQDAAASAGGGGSCKALQPAHGEPQGKAERCRPVARGDAGIARRGLHLVQRGTIERPADTAIDLAFAEGPRSAGMQVRHRGERGRAALERADVGPQACERLGPARRRKRFGFVAVEEPAPRNGEEGLAVPVRAGAPKPYATQPIMTRVITGARLWPRDRGQTTGRWGGGWGRLIHGNALAPIEATAARMPSRSFFVLDERRSPVKTKPRTKTEHRSCSSAHPARHNFSTGEGLPTGESIRHATGMPHYQARNCRKFRLLRVHLGNSPGKKPPKRTQRCDANAGVSLMLCREKMGLLYTLHSPYRPMLPSEPN